MNGQEVNDGVYGGLDPRQHHAAAARVVGELAARGGVRIEGRDEVGRYLHVEGTAGTELGGYCWPYAGQPPPLVRPPAPPPLRDLPAWGYAFPAVVVGGSRGEAPTPDDPFGPVIVLQGDQGTIGNQAPGTAASTGATRTKSEPPSLPREGLVLPILTAPAGPDVRFAPQLVRFQAPTPPRVPGTLMNATHEGRQEAVFVPSRGPLVAVNAGGDPATASLVFDEKDDGDPDETRFARLQSLVRVVRPKDDAPGSKLNFGGVNSGSLALQLTFGGKDGLAGYGLTVDRPFRSASDYGASLTAAVNRTAVPGPNAFSLGIAGGSSGSGRDRSSNVMGLTLDYDSGVGNLVNVPTLDGLFKEPEANAIVTQLIRAGYRNAKKVIARPYDPSFGYERQDLFRIETGEATPLPGEEVPTEKPTKDDAALAVGALSRWASGPIDSGGPGCPHQIGTTHDGQRIYSDHLTTDTYFRDLHFDGPILFESYLDQEPRSGPFRIKCHVVWNDRLSHPHVTGEKKGRWVVVAETMDFVTKPVLVPIDPRDGTTTTGSGGPGGNPVCNDPPQSSSRGWRASPFMAMSPGQIFVPQPYDPGLDDLRQVPDRVTAAQLREVEQRPAVLRMEAFGARIDGDWDRRRSDLSSAASEVPTDATNFPGGTADGGLYYSVPEQDIKNEINNQAYLNPPPDSGTKILYDPLIKVGYGAPTSSGGARGLTPGSAFSPFVAIPNTAVAGQTLVVNTGASGSTPAAATFQSWDPSVIRFAGLGSAQRLLVSNASSGVGALSTLAPGSDTQVLTMVAGAIAWAASAAGTTDFADNVFRVHDDGDATKLLALQVSGVTTGTTRTWTVADASGTVVTTGNLTAIVATGTIASGVWNGTKVSEAYGGTNQSTYTAGDLLYATAANTLGKLGVSTDGFVLTLVAGAPAWAASAGGSFGTVDDAATNTVSTYGTLVHTTSGTATTGFGGRLLLQLEDGAGNTQDAGSIEIVWTDATDGGEDSELDLYTFVGGAKKLGVLVNQQDFQIYKDDGATTAFGILRSTGDVITGVWKATAVAAIYGGTGQTTYTTGDLLYASGASALSKLGIGSAGLVLTSVAGAPAWSATTSITGVGTVVTGTWNATVVGVAYGGTGLATFGAAGALPYSTGATTLAALAAGTYGYVLTMVAGAPAWAAAAGGSFTGTLDVSQGGTGLTTAPGNGQLLIGNGGVFAMAAPTAVGFATINLGAGALEVSVQLATLCGLRLTLETGVANSSTDQTAKTTLYLTPDESDELSLKYGGVWTRYSTASADLSITLAGLPATTCHDVFAYATSATACALELVAWASSGYGTSTRATALARDTGRWVKSGDASRLYLGTICTAAAGQCEDSKTKRLVWNAYNRLSRSLSVVDTANQWTVTGGGWAQANASAANQIELVAGLLDEDVDLTVYAQANNTIGAAVNAGVGVNTTTANSAQVGGMNATAAGAMRGDANYVGRPPVGRNYYAWIEHGGGGGVTTMYGDQGGLAGLQMGMQGRWAC